MQGEDKGLASPLVSHFHLLGRICWLLKYKGRNCALKTSLRFYGWFSQHFNSFLDNCSGTKLVLSSTVISEVCVACGKEDTKARGCNVSTVANRWRLITVWAETHVLMRNLCSPEERFLLCACVCHTFEIPGRKLHIWSLRSSISSFIRL